MIRSGAAEVPRVVRTEKALDYRAEILELIDRCKGNLVRVHEELIENGATLSYQALTGFCRRHGIGSKPKLPVGRYEFKAGQEMQHDTSPHRVEVGGRKQLAQTASLVLCYSRVLFIQIYPRFTRFECKIFLAEALNYFGGSCSECMVDNSNLVVAHGTGQEMVAVPEMAAFGERYGFEFVAHEKGDANRSARVERNFHYAENNFLAGRSFANWEELNREARAWCDRVNAKYRKHIKAIPLELFASERSALKALPIWVPEIYRLHHRIVDSEGYVHVDTNRYSAPSLLIGRRVEARESKEHIEIYLGPRLVAKHRRDPVPANRRITRPEHRVPRGKRKKHGPCAEERALLAELPEIAEYVAALKKRVKGRGTQLLRRLLVMVHDYPREPLLDALRIAAHYGLYELDRVERLVLRSVTDEYFRISKPREGDPFRD